VSLALAWRLKEGLFLRALAPAAAGLLVSGALAWAGHSVTSWAICAGAAAAAGVCVVWADAKRRDGLRMPANLSWLILSGAAVVIASALDPRQALYSVTAVGFSSVLVAGWERKQGRRDLFHAITVTLSTMATVAAVALVPVSGLGFAGAGVCVLGLSAAYAMAWGLGRGTGYARGALGLLALGLLLVVFGEFRTADARLAAGAIAVLALFTLGAASRPRFREIASSAAFAGHASSAVLAGAALVQAWPLGRSWLPLAAAAYVLLYGLMPRLRTDAGFRFGVAGWLSLLALFALSAVTDAPYREHLLPMAVLALIWVALGYSLHRTEAESWSLPLYICGAVLAACCGGVSLLAPTAEGAWRVYLANGFVFALLFLMLRQDILAYLLTLSLSLIAYDWVKASTSPFTQDVLFYLVIGAGAMGLFFLLPHLKTAVDRIGALPMVGIHTWRGAALASVPALGIGVFLLSAYSVKITEHPRFCTSCHNMAAYYESWQHSSHKDVSCVKCHYEPGAAAEVKGKMEGLVQLIKYVSHTQAIKPHALISDESCMRAGCHPQQDHSDKLLLLAGKIKFRHDEHLGGQPRGHVLHCDNCHKMVQEGVHIAVTEAPCLTCHFYGRGDAPVAVGDCQTCHVLPEGDVSFAGQPFNHREFLADKKGVQCIQCHSNVTEGQGRVAPERCKSCHLKAFSDIGDHAQLHTVHTSQQHLECLQCHDEIKHGIHPMVEQLLTSKNCTTCHGGERHTIQERIYSGTAVPEVESIPDVMYKAGVACDGCHTDVHFIKAGEMVLSTRVAGGKQCAQCHANESYTQMVAVWQKDVKGRLTELQATADELAGLCKTADAAKGQVARAKELLAGAQGKLTIVNLDGSYGAHNVAYVSAILDSAESDLKEGNSAIAELKNPDQRGSEQ
jgi:nitrate/TMAO reductase-like tetraheme cytochrome c subunit